MKNLLLQSFELTEKLRDEFGKLTFIEKCGLLLDLQDNNNDLHYHLINNVLSRDLYVPNWADGDFLSDVMLLDKYEIVNLDLVLFDIRYARSKNDTLPNKQETLAHLSTLEESKLDVNTYEYLLFNMLKHNVGSFIYDW